MPCIFHTRPSRQTSIQFGLAHRLNRQRPAMMSTRWHSVASTLQNNLGHLHLWLLEQLDGTYETYARAPLASPVAWVVSLGPVGQARLQLKSCTRNSIFLDPKLFQTYQYKKGGWLIAEVVIVFSWRFVRK